MKMIRSPFLAVLMVLLVSGCDPPPPAWVWVPSDDFKARLHVYAGGGASKGVFEAGAWITLHADRSTGPWRRVRYKDLPDGARWMRNPPPAEEHDVEANVRWLAEPSGSHEFNIPTAINITTRKVKFDRPGEYKVWAESRTLAGFDVKSNVIGVTVHSPFL